jgi:hypothetical protein
MLASIHSGFQEVLSILFLDKHKNYVGSWVGTKHRDKGLEMAIGTLLGRCVGGTELVCSVTRSFRSLQLIGCLFRYKIIGLTRESEHSSKILYIGVIFSFKF